MHLAFIGLGTLGSLLAGRLAAEHTLTVHDRNPSCATAVVDAGTRWCSSPSDAVRGVDAVLTCLPSPQASREVMLGRAGCLAALAPGTAWVELSTVGPQEVAEWNSAAEQHSVALLECPVTGGVHRAASGEMTMFVGAAPDSVERMRPVLEAMCSQVLHLGPVGSAATAKLITNMLCMVDLIAASDAILLAERAGLDLRQFYRAVVASSGNSREFEDWAPRILDGSFDTGFTLALALKDLGLMSDVSQRLSVSPRLLGQVIGLLESAKVRYGADAMTANVFRMMAEEAGIVFRPTPLDDEDHDH